MNRSILSPEKGFLLLILYCLFSLSLLEADDLSTASGFEKNGQSSEARSLYISWLKKEANHTNPSYGRTLLHVLRMGGDSDEIFQLLDLCYSGVSNLHDRIEVLKFGAYVADLSGRSEKAEVYFSRLHEMENMQYDWILFYYDVIKGSDEAPEDPLAVAFHTNSELFVKNKALVYFIYLSNNNEDLRSVINWQEQAEGLFPFLKKYPEWLFLNWYFYSRGGDMVRAGDYKTILQNNYPKSPETAIAVGRIRLLSNPAFLIGQGDSETLDTAVPAVDFQVLFYLQAGAFSSRANAVSLQQDIKSKTGFSSSLHKRGEIYKVVIETNDPVRDQKLLGRNGFEVFRIPQP